MKLEKVILYYSHLKDNHYVTTPLTTTKLCKMHSSGRLAGYLENVQNAYKRIHIKDQKQALEVMKVRFHNQNLIGALNEKLTKEQKSNPGYAYSCCIGPRVNTSWTAVCRTITTTDSTTAGYVRDTHQVLEIDQLEDGELVFAVLEHKDTAAEYAHNLFWAYCCNGEWTRARQMAKAMKFVWDGQLASYYDMMYERLGYHITP